MLLLNDDVIFQVLNDSRAYSYDSFKDKDGRVVEGGVTHPVNCLVEDKSGRVHFVVVKISPCKVGDVVKRGEYKIKDAGSLPWYDRFGKVIKQTKIDLADHPMVAVK